MGILLATAQSSINWSKSVSGLRMSIIRISPAKLLRLPR